jgi:hypothetical protein
MPQIDFPNCNFNVTKLDDGTTFTADLSGKELNINNTVTHNNTTINSNNILLKSGDHEVTSSRVKIDADSIRNNFAIELYGLNNDPTSQTLLSTRGTTNSLHLQDPPVSYIQANSVANIDFTVGGHYTDYTDGSSNINRIYTGFYRDTEPSIGAFTATSQNDLLYPQNSTPLDINVRSDLDFGYARNIKNLLSVSLTDLTTTFTTTLNDSLTLTKNTLNTTYSYLGINSNQSSFDMSFNALTFKGVMGTAGQVLKTDASGNASWQNIYQPVIKYFNNPTEWNNYMSPTRIISGSIFIISFNIMTGNNQVFLPPNITSGDYFIIVNRTPDSHVLTTVINILGGTGPTDQYLTLGPNVATPIYFIEGYWYVMTGNLIT